MPETIAAKQNGQVQPAVVPGPTLAELQAQLLAMAQKVAEVQAENAALRAKPTTGTLYEVTEPTVDYPNPTFRISLPGSKAIMGKRAKFLHISEEVKSGRWDAFIAAHPEVK